MTAHMPTHMSAHMSAHICTRQAEDQKRLEDEHEAAAASFKKQVCACMHALVHAALLMKEGRCLSVCPCALA